MHNSAINRANVSSAGGKEILQIVGKVVIYPQCKKNTEVFRGLPTFHELNKSIQAQSLVLLTFTTFI